VLLEQGPRLLPRLVRLRDRLPDPLAAFLDDLLDGREGVPLQHEERDEEADDRPDHQPRHDLDEGVVGEHRVPG
jgi:hypothetical protein